jgi:hypothetical protein
MKQSEIRTFQIGIGVGRMMETSNNPAIPLPRLTLMFPWCPGYGDEHAIPANSVELGAKDVKQLYDALHAYYTQENKVCRSTRKTLYETTD